MTRRRSTGLDVLAGGVIVSFLVSATLLVAANLLSAVMARDDGADAILLAFAAASLGLFGWAAMHAAVLVHGSRLRGASLRWGGWLERDDVLGFGARGPDIVALRGGAQQIARVPGFLVGEPWLEAVDRLERGLLRCDAWFDDEADVTND